MTTLPAHRCQISFGDCDPAGIVFYPNIFRWMDAAFHATLHGLGGHQQICGRLDAIGLGLMQASCDFAAPMRNGDLLEIRPVIADWGRRSLTLDYEGIVAERTTFKGREVRGIFRNQGDGLSAGEIEDLRQIFRAAGLG